MMLYGIDSEIGLYKDTSSTKSNNHQYSICIRYKSSNDAGFSIGMLFYDSCYITAPNRDCNFSSWEFVKLINEDSGVISRVRTIFDSLQNTEMTRLTSSTWWYSIDVDFTKEEYNQLIYEQTI